MNMTEIQYQFPPRQDESPVIASAHRKCGDGILCDGNSKAHFRHDHQDDPVFAGDSDGGNHDGNGDDGNPSLRERRGGYRHTASFLRNRRQ